MARVKYLHISDDKLLSLVKEDNKLAFGELYNRYWEKLFQFGLSVLKDEEQVKDIVQDIFLTVWNKRAGLGIKNPGGYLMASVKHEVTRALKKGRLTTSQEAYVATIPSLNTTEEQLFLKDLEQEIQGSLNSLSDKSKKVFHLSRYDHLSNKEIADKLGLSQRTVEWHISNALQHLSLKITRTAFFLLPLIIF